MPYVGKQPKVYEYLKFFCAPGNGGTEEIAENININPDEIDKLLEFAETEAIDLTIVGGPENPLAMEQWINLKKRV